MESKSLFVKYIDSEGNERFFPNDQYPLVLSTWTYEGAHVLLFNHTGDKCQASFMS